MTYDWFALAMSVTALAFSIASLIIVRRARRRLTNGR